MGGRNGSYEFCSIGYDFETVVLSLKRGKKKKKMGFKKKTHRILFLKDALVAQNLIRLRIICKGPKPINGVSN